MHVDILLATYNGERYLPQQLDSILNQTHSDWHIIARDDASQDGTLDILEDFRSQYPDRMTVMQSHENVNVAKSFEILMGSSINDYVSFSDQDDIWQPTKLATSLAAIKEAEDAHGSRCALLIHHDMSIIDEDNNQTAPSYEKNINGEKQIAASNTLSYKTLCMALQHSQTGHL